MRAALEALDVSLPSFLLYFMHFYDGYKGGLIEREIKKHFFTSFIISIQVDEADNATPTLF